MPLTIIDLDTRITHDAGDLYEARCIVRDHGISAFEICIGDHVIERGDDDLRATVSQEEP